MKQMRTKCKHVWRPLQWFGRHPKVGVGTLHYRCAVCWKEYNKDDNR